MQGVQHVVGPSAGLLEAYMMQQHRHQRQCGQENDDQSDPI
jgi:hypothetical protein